MEPRQYKHQGDMLKYPRYPVSMLGVSILEKIYEVFVGINETFYVISGCPYEAGVRRAWFHCIKKRVGKTII